MNVKDLVIDAKATIGENLVCVDVIEKGGTAPPTRNRKKIGGFLLL